MAPVLRVGLTGGIASGKTTVGGFLAEAGALVLDADEIAHRLMGPGGATHAALVEEFGREVLDATGHVDRPRLARQVFADAHALRRLNEIVHPAVRAEVERRIDAAERAGRARIVVLDAALLVETGRDGEFHRLVVVRCGRETQMERLRARNRISSEEAAARIDAQAPLTEKLARADYVIDTERTLDETRAQTARVFAELLVDHARRFGEAPPELPADP